MTRVKSVWAAALIAATAPAALGVGMYCGGGLAAYGSTEVTSPYDVTDGDMGTSWQVGGGFAMPVWWWRGAVVTTLELTTDVNFSMIDNEFEEPGLDYVHLKVTAIPIREALLFGVGVGPRAMIKPYGGFGGGVSIIMWKAYYGVPGYPELDIDDGTAVKPTISIPFGCEFRLTPSFSLGPRAEYLIILGEVEGYDPWVEDPFAASVPDVFTFGAEARFDF